MTRNFAVIGLVLFVLLTARCNSNRPAPPQPSKPNNARITAANLFAQRCARSRLSGWHVRASAAGSDCGILFVDVPIIMEDSMIEAMHYGAGPYHDVYEGGVQRFCGERTFRAVVYKDASGRVWTYGAVLQSEAEGLVPCH